MIPLRSAKSTSAAATLATLLPSLSHLGDMPDNTLDTTLLSGSNMQPVKNLEGGINVPINTPCFNLPWRREHFYKTQLIYTFIHCKIYVSIFRQPKQLDLIQMYIVLTYLCPLLITRALLSSQCIVPPGVNNNVYILYTSVQVSHVALNTQMTHFQLNISFPPKILGAF